MDQHVGVFGDLDDPVAWSCIAGIDEGAAVRFQPEGIGLDIARLMPYLANGHLPAVAFDHLAVGDRRDDGARPCARQGAAAIEIACLLPSELSLPFRSG